ncbi:MAG: CDP-alcohol phosphatidyltransferase family protein [Polyangiales bacterium]|nr:CDP-alcohol phosphatidyltransferase family protein [Myxococcales bacterium]MCB9658636.1 CDP-alcohol phosphatidyltransferase family protein [Sandaracinaceae bacterium]
MNEANAAASPAPRALIVGSVPTRVWGLSGEERLRRLFATRGIEATLVPDVAAAVLAAGASADQAGAVIGIRGDYVFEATLIVNLMATEGTVLCLPSGQPVAFHVPSALARDAAAALGEAALPRPLADSQRVVLPADLAYNQQLRKRATPYVLPISDEARDAIERQVFAGSYKGVTDVATKYLFPFPVRKLTQLSAALGLRPNHVTTLSFVLTVLATWLFYRGQFGLGVIVGWGMCLLDSVDGKLARVTLTSSKFGDYFDHSIDLVHPPFWYWGFMTGLGAAFSDHPWSTAVFWSIMILYVAQRLLEGLFIVGFGVEMHIWRPVDSAFRLVTARRNPNLIILTLATLVGRPLEGILVVAAWTVFSFVVHLLQVVQAALYKATGRPIVSWLTQEAPAD